MKCQMVYNITDPHVLKGHAVVEIFEEKLVAYV
jgi:hypothetical protein